MTTITVKVTGKLESLKDALVFAFHFYSSSKISRNEKELTLTYIYETPDPDSALSLVKNDIDILMVQSLGLELESFAVG